MVIYRMRKLSSPSIRAALHKTLHSSWKELCCISHIRRRVCCCCFMFSSSSSSPAFLGVEERKKKFPPNRFVPCAVVVFFFLFFNVHLQSLQLTDIQHTHVLFSLLFSALLWQSFVFALASVHIDVTSASSKEGKRKKSQS